MVMRGKGKTFFHEKSRTSASVLFPSLPASLSPFQATNFFKLPFTYPCRKQSLYKILQISYDLQYFFMQKNKKIKYLIAKNQTWSYIYKTDIKSGHSAVA